MNRPLGKGGMVSGDLDRPKGGHELPELAIGSSADD
jgi:hypothetical protein